MDETELEDGEITDSDDETGEITAKSSISTINNANVDAEPNDYTLLPRPTNPALCFRVPQESPSATNSFRDTPAGLQDDSDSGSADSDDDTTSGKRQRLNRPPPRSASLAKKMNVWADVLLEQQISAKIKSSGTILDMENADTVERGVESYIPSGESRTVGFDTEEKEQGELDEGELWDVNEDGESGNTTKDRAGKKNTIKDRLNYDFTENGEENYGILSELPSEICAEDDEREIARYIARNLNEPKTVLIERVTRFAGKQKALDLFNTTMDVESAGGMLTASGDTRRTPGGVFLQLLKKDKNISKETIKDIFAVERENQKFVKKVLIKDRQTRKRKYYNKLANQNTEVLAPPTPLLGNEMEAVDEFELMEEPDIVIGVNN